MDFEKFGKRVDSVLTEINGNADNVSNLRRENGNINGSAPMGAMLQSGANVCKDYYLEHMNADIAKMHRDGDIHIHDLDFYGWTTTCCQIDLCKLFDGGFSTGHGHLREPKSIGSYAALAAIAIQSNQNDQHGGQSIVDFDRAMAKGVHATYEHYLKEAAGIYLEIGDAWTDRDIWMESYAVRQTERDTYQAMEGLIHNLNTMHSRAGAQVPFSSINYGTDTSWEGRMAIEQLLLATSAGLGNGETPIFPIQIFRVKEGVNYNEGDPNYDLFKLAMRVSAKRLFPNFSFIDAPFNLKYYDPERPETEVAYMGCRTRVLGNTYDPTREISNGRGNLSFTSINLPRLAIETSIVDGGDIDKFYERLRWTVLCVFDQLRERFEVQAERLAKNYPFLMGQGVWIDSDKLGPNDKVREVLKHGTLSVGFIGLAECLKMLTGKHHGESKEAQELGLRIIRTMRRMCDVESQLTGMNYTLLATPAEGLSGGFVRKDRGRYGIIEGVTDREFYTNSFHVPVYYPISAYNKIRTEAPYHALTNAGHISYVELDGDPQNNLEAFEAVVRCMHDEGIGYGSINHPVDRDPECGYNGIIGDTCPRCGRRETPDRPFERIRRITGYLVGTLDRWNDAKRAEERARVKHGV